MLLHCTSINASDVGETYPLAESFVSQGIAKTRRREPRKSTNDRRRLSSIFHGESNVRDNRAMTARQARNESGTCVRDIRGFSSFHAKSVFRRAIHSKLCQSYSRQLFQLVARNLHASREVNKSCYGRDLCLSRVKDNTAAGEVCYSRDTEARENAFSRGNSADREQAEGLSSNSKLWQRVAI